MFIVHRLSPCSNTFPMCNRKEKKKTKLAVMPSMEENETEDESEGSKKKKKQKNKYKIQHEEISSTTPDSQSGKGWSPTTHQSSYTPRTYLLIKPGQEDLEEEVEFLENSSKLILCIFYHGKSFSEKISWKEIIFE